jgi:hypothetical protein
LGTTIRQGPFTGGALSSQIDDLAEEILAMARTIAALFDDPGRAEQALQALMTAGLSGHRSVLIQSEAHATEMAPFRDASAGGDRPNLHSPAIPAEDRALFEAGVRRGGCVLLAEIAGNPDEAVRIIETFEPSDLDGRTEARRRQRGNAGGAASGIDVGAPLGAGLTAGMGQGDTNLESAPGMGAMAHDPSILGAADLQGDDLSRHNQGRSTVALGDLRSEERAGAPGVNELRGAAGGMSKAEVAAKMSPMFDNPTRSGDEVPSQDKRATVGLGRVRSYPLPGT